MQKERGPRPKKKVTKKQNSKDDDQTGSKSQKTGAVCGKKIFSLLSQVQPSKATSPLRGANSITLREPPNEIGPQRLPSKTSTVCPASSADYQNYYLPENMFLPSVPTIPWLQFSSLRDLLLIPPPLYPTGGLHNCFPPTCLQHFTPLLHFPLPPLNQLITAPPSAASWLHPPELETRLKRFYSPLHSDSSASSSASSNGDSCGPNLCCNIY